MVDIEGAITVPEDEGTGLSDPEEADWTSSGHVSALSAIPEVSDVVATGMSFENVSDGSFDITGGLALVYHDGTVQVQDENGVFNKDWEYGVVFAVHADRTDEISYSEGSTNYVYIDVGLTEGNDARYEIETTESAPPSPSLKIGEIGPSDDVTEVNREPELITDHRQDESAHSEAEYFTLRTYDDEEDLPSAPEGSIAVVNGELFIEDGE